MSTARHARETRRCERRSMRSTTSCRPAPPKVEPLTPRPAADRDLLALAREPWVLRVGHMPLLVRPSTARDLAAVAQMHGRCSPRALLDRYRAGGRPPAVAAVDEMLRRPDTFVAATPEGEAGAGGTPGRDRAPHHPCAQVRPPLGGSWQAAGPGGG